MTIRSRYGLVILAIIGYYGHFFVPLFSLTTAAPVSNMGLIPGTEFLKGLALFDYHYLSIGIVPFIFSSITVQVMRWQMPGVFSVVSGAKGSAEGFQRTLLYAFSSVMASVSVSQIPEGRFLIAPWLTVTEMLVSVWSIEQVVNFVKRLDVLSSPVMLFLGLNVTSSIIYSVYVLDFNAFTPQVFSLFMLSIIIGLSLLLMIIWSLFWSTKFYMGRTMDATGKMSLMPVRFKVLRAGITPVIYTLFLVFPLMAWLQPGQPFLNLISHPQWLLIMFFLMTYLSYRLTLLNVPVADMAESARSVGLVVVKADRVFTDISATLRSMAKKQACIASCWFMALIVSQSLWQTYAPKELVGLEFIGGIGVVLIVGVLYDIAKSHKKLKLREGTRI
jgi:hypothetical protein